MGYKFWMFCLLVIGPGALKAQGYEKQNDAFFAWEVKQVDEFIERFNNEDQTLIKKYVKKNDPTVDLTREKLLKSLFNADDKNWNINEIKSFIAKVNDKQSPVLIDFFGDNWYAKVNCEVTWNGKPQNTQLTLMIKKLHNGGSKWVITSVKAEFLKSLTGKQGAVKIPDAKDSTTSLNPLSHTTEFMNIDHVSLDKLNIKNYFDDGGKNSGDMLAFENEIVSSHLIINKTTGVSYCFSQVPGWFFVVDQFNRPSKNSGWLISKLVKTSTQ